MTLLLSSIHRLLFFFILVQSASFYKIYTSNDNHPNSLSSPFDEEINQGLSINNLGDDDDDGVAFVVNIGENNDNLVPWLSLLPEMNQEQRPLSKRSTKFLLQRRNNRPNWNPLIAAYKRCGELLVHEERESCFKDAVQLFFAHKLRK